MQLVQIYPCLLRWREESHTARAQEGGRGTTDQRKLRQTMTPSSAFLPLCGKQPRPGGNKIYIWIPRPFIHLLECAIPPPSQKIQFTSSLCISQTWSTGFLQSFRQCFWLPDFNISWNFWISWTFSDFICVGHPAWAPEEFRASRLIYLNVGVSYVATSIQLFIYPTDRRSALEETTVISS